MFKSIILLLLLMCFANMNAEAQQKTTLTLLADKPSYYIIQPIKLKTTLHNNQNKEIIINSYNTRIYYRKIGDKEFIPYTRGFGTEGMQSTNSFQLKPNEEIIREHILLYDGKTEQFVLDSPGIYELKVIATSTIDNTKQKTYESDSIQIKVIEVPSYEKDAVAYLKNANIGIILNVLDSRTIYEGIENMFEKATYFVELYSNSMYTPYVIGSINLSLNSLRTQDGNLPIELQTMHERVKNISKTYNIKPETLW